MDAKWIAWIYPLICVLLLMKVDGFFVNITYVMSAIAKGAVCLDGSPPAYHLSPGCGSGVNNWLVHMEGGGWCDNVTTCLARKNTRLGSSKQMAKQLAFSGILSNSKAYNPDFFNWNRVKVRYCDGSSFTGDVEIVDPVTKLHYRGARIWVAVMKDLLAKGMKNAENALLSGCSAGGLTSMLHCDSFRALLPIETRVKCLSDAGYFINAKDIKGVDYIRSFYNGVVTTHGSAKHLPSSCTSRLEPAMCFFPENFAPKIRTPLFIVNAAYDHWQIRNILVPGDANSHGTWTSCKLDIRNCTAAQLQIIQGFRMKFLHALAAVGNSTDRGLFINSCFIHCQTELQETWFEKDSPMLKQTPNSPTSYDGLNLSNGPNSLDLFNIMDGLANDDDEEMLLELIEETEWEEISSSRRRAIKRTYICMSHKAGHDRWFNDQFCDNSVFSCLQFRRRFWMRRHLSLWIIVAV